MGLFASVLLSMPLCLAQSPDEKDTAASRALITMVLNAQKAAEQSFPSGTCTARAVNSTTGLPKTAEVRCVWDADKLYLEAQGHESVVDKKRRAAEPVRVPFHRKQILTPAKSYYFDVANALLQIVDDGQFSGWNYLKTAPPSLWYKVNPRAPMKWSEMLDKLLAPDSPWESRATLTKDESDERIRIDYFHRATKTPCVVEFSLQKGGNVIFGSSNPPSDPPGVQRSERTYEWERVDSQRWRLSRLVYRTVDSSQQLSEATGEFEVVVTSFSAADKVPATQFEMASLNLPKGTLVEELGTKPRRYRIGGMSKPEGQPTESQFTEWAEQLKSAPFQSKQQ